MVTNKNLVVFDFCETLVNFQSADKFIFHILENNKTFWSIFSKRVNALFSFFKVYSIFNKINPELNLSKRIVLLGLRGISKDTINEAAESYLNDVVLLNLNTEVFNYLEQHKTNGDLLLLSSGGYHPYLELFQKKLSFNYLMCSKIEFTKNLATGFLEGNDCMHKNKVTLLKDLIRLNNLNYNQIITYTDSITDMPLLKFSNIGYVISYNSNRDWVKNEKFNEIIIKR